MLSLLATTVLLLAAGVSAAPPNTNGRNLIQPGGRRDMCMRPKGTQTNIGKCGSQKESDVWLFWGGSKPDMIYLPGSKKCLFASGLSSGGSLKIANGDKLFIQPCRAKVDRSRAQPDIFEVYNNDMIRVANTNFCLDNKDGKFKNVQVWECADGNPNQRFDFNKIVW